MNLGLVVVLPGVCAKHYKDHFQLQQEGFIFAVCGWLKLDFVGPSSCVFAKTCKGC